MSYAACRCGDQELLMSTVDSLRALDLTPELVSASISHAAAFHVSPALHECDNILSYIIQYSEESVAHGPAAGVHEYFQSGKSDAIKIEALIAKLGLGAQSRILEFAAGFGRVTRHLTRYHVTASDIHGDAVRFLEQELGVRAIPSDTDPDAFVTTERFDFIFVLSLFSHLPAGLFERWLARLAQTLSPGGFLMFTTHGDTAGRKIQAFADALDHETGFGFLAITDQGDIAPELYGSSIATTPFVIERIYRCTDARIASFSAAAWWELQDEWVIQRALAPPETTTQG
jgi:SAM-dependent methyltransferase